MPEKLELQVYVILITLSLQLKAVNLVIVKHESDLAHEATFPTDAGCPSVHVLFLLTNE